ncbi:MAG TPA: hypothetical protein VL096_20720 [Pirellulaceae bacterium]|nr:hypothetical protein [Pirellulaceae bacterium]
MLIEQAIFTSLKTQQQEGYQLAAKSPGIGAALARELDPWGPAHDALLVGECGATSLNFHPLSTGDFCLSKTFAAGDEYSGRGGPRIYTQMLILTPAVLRQFGSQPFAIAEAMTAAGTLQVCEQVPATLPPLNLLGKATALNQLRLAELLIDVGLAPFARFVHLAVNSTRLAVRSPVPLERLFAGLLMVLPPTYRPQVSFSTGLRSSPRRPFRLFGLSPDTAEQRMVQRTTDAELLDLTRRTREEMDELPPGYASMLGDVFETRQLGLLTEILRRADLYCEQGLPLDEAALRLQADVEVEA